MTTEQNSSVSLIVVSIVAALLVLGATILVMRGPATESRSTITAPGVDIQTQGDNVKIDAPHTSIKSDESGTSIKAPGVDIQLPPSKPAE